MPSALTAEIAATAAKLVVEEGMEYGPAKRRAARAFGKHGARSAEMPDNASVEEEVRAYLALFCAESQPAELAALREVAVHWMERLAEFRPHLTGAVWRGTATRLSSVHLQLFCDDPKSAEISMLNLGIDFDIGSVTGPRNLPVDLLSVSSRSPALGEEVTVFLTVLDHDDLRGGLKPDASGLTQRGDLNALRRLMETET
ncbi:MAG: hypothetical protein QFE16_10960 [Pseudomonadota bacterium]|nr:hypothetical protein [Pseudomonadota bacterium]